MGLIQTASPLEYEFKTKPFGHQLDEWNLSRELEARAVFWEQGTGKSKLMIDTACWMFIRGLIDAVVVVAPNGVHRNWVENEIPDHTPDAVLKQSRAFQFQSPKADTKWHKQAVRSIVEHRGLSWFAISYDAFTTLAGKRALISIFDKRRVLYVLDEGHYIKSPNAERTKSILRSSIYAPFRRLLTGTPIAQGPFDAYSEIKFLVDTYWDQHGLGTYTEFKTHFGVFKKVRNQYVKSQFNAEKGRWEKAPPNGALVDTLVGYRNLSELNELLKPITTRVTKDDVLDLPPKLYTKRYFTMSPEQAKLYKQMKDDCIAWIDFQSADWEANATAPAEAGVCQTCSGKKEVESDGYIYQCPDCAAADLPDGATPVIAQLAIVKLLRLQQITCGYLPTEDADEPLYMIPGPNRRLQEMCDEIATRPHKTIVWARFQMDVTLIVEELERRGIKTVRYDGLVSDDQRAEAKALFNGERPIYERGVVVGRAKVPEEEQAMVFVGNPAAGATGLTLTIAKFTDYYSNSYKLIDRLQSEDRNHRIGQDNQVLYTDWIAEDTIDEKIVEALRAKFNIASQITGDRLKEWL
ncbi:DNA helicase [Stenotrophomonas phage Sonora]|nr:DNA helicase [Stenotrophomonas phage Sonora]